MGAAMASRIAGKASLVPWNRSAAALEQFTALGIAPASTAKEALSCELSFSMLANDAVTDEVLTKDNLAPGTIHVCMASISPALATGLEARFEGAQATFVSAPVVGRPHVAESGQLNILAAGPRSAIDKAQPLFDLMGKKTWILGDVPSKANLVKIAVNYNILHTIQSLAESVAIVEKHGIDAKEFIDVLTGTLFAGVAHTGYGTQVANSSYEPTMFSMELGRKDLALAMQAAEEVELQLPSAEVLAGLLEKALSDPDLASKDWAAMAEITLGRRPSKG
jgi:3-hydroxyisobutyrate dehydrogenase-like beta-hydroxyacid dehydrogenase